MWRSRGAFGAERYIPSLELTDQASVCAAPPVQRYGMSTEAVLSDDEAGSIAPNASAEGPPALNLQLPPASTTAPTAIACDPAHAPPAASRSATEMASRAALRLNSTTG